MHLSLQYLSNHGIPDEEIQATFREVSSTSPFPPVCAIKLIRPFSLAQSKKFFELPLEVKDPLAWEGELFTPLRAENGATEKDDELILSRSLPFPDPRANRGWVAHGRERVTQSADPEEILKMRAQAPDYKESMEVGRERDPGDVKPKWKNQWPPAGVLDSYKPQVLKFFDLNHKLQLEVMRSIALGLKLEESYFDDKVGRVSSLDRFFAEMTTRTFR